MARRVHRKRDGQVFVFRREDVTTHTHTYTHEEELSRGFDKKKNKESKGALNMVGLLLVLYDILGRIVV